MKIYLLSLLVMGLAGALLSPQLRAQDGQAGKRLAFLSAEDRAHYLKVRQEVLASHPELKTEQENLEKERESLRDQSGDASADQRKTLWEDMLAHAKKMKAAMQQADPSIAPVLAQIDAKMKERFAQHAASGGTAGN